MSDEAMKKAIRGQERAELGAFAIWCKRRGIEPTDPQAVAQYWDERAEKEEARQRGGL